MVAMDRGRHYVSGKLTGLNRPVRDFFCKTPAETREDLPKGVDVVAFQCRNPIHRAHYEVHTAPGQIGQRLGFVTRLSLRMRACVHCCCCRHF